MKKDYNIWLKRDRIVLRNKKKIIVLKIKNKQVYFYNIKLNDNKKAFIKNIFPLEFSYLYDDCHSLRDIDNSGCYCSYVDRMIGCNLKFKNDRRIEIRGGRVKGAFYEK